MPSSSTTTVDQYTGEKTTHTQPGYRVNQITAEITIKNQPFTPYTNENGREINLFYKFDVKGHFGENWEREGYSSAIVQSKSGYTILSYVVTQATGSKLDFKVQAVVGYEYDEVAESGSSAAWWGYTAWVVRSLESSNWSNIQTVTISDMFSSSASSQTTTPSQNPTAPPNNNKPQQPDQNMPSFVLHPYILLWIGILLFAGVIITVVIMFAKRHLKNSTYNNLPLTNNHKNYAVLVLQKI